MLRKYKYLISSILVFILVFLVYYFWKIIATEGFNPSDDGVILAQSFRLLNGEIPHKDFIAIRPVFSGILHTIHFYSPFPLEISARWFVFIQYFIYSFVWTYLLFINFIKNPKIKYFAIVAIACFLLNINFYNLFPWTTIDALFWIILGLAFLLTSLRKGLVTSQILAGLGFLFMSLAALSRQTFFLPFLVIWVLFFIKMYKNKKLKHIIIPTLIGSIPVVAYIVFLILNDALLLSVKQLLGRTELVETGIVTFRSKLFSSRLVFVHAFALIGIIAHLYNNKFKTYVSISKKNHRLFFSFLGIYFGALLFYIFYIFFQDIEGLFKNSFEFFWISCIAAIYILLIFKLDFAQKLLVVSTILFAWTSAISLGDNAPVFSIGVLVSFSVIIIYRLSATLNNLPFKMLSPKSIYLITATLCIFLFYLEMRNQRIYNYRDKRASKLTSDLGEIYPEFGRVKTNENTYSYYKELKLVISQLENATNNFVVVPENPIIYPISNSRNPFPLDWMQKGEYFGSEIFLKNKIIETIERKSIYIIKDKQKVKIFAQGIYSKEYDSKYYDYLEYLYPRMEKLDIESQFFEVYKTNKQ